MAMKVKRFEASTMREAILKVKHELGAEAVILHTRKYDKPEFFGLRRRNFVEVIAATDINGIRVRLHECHGFFNTGRTSITLHIAQHTYLLGK